MQPSPGRSRLRGLRRVRPRSAGSTWTRTGGSLRALRPAWTLLQRPRRAAPVRARTPGARAERLVRADVDRAEAPRRSAGSSQRRQHLGQVVGRSGDASPSGPPASGRADARSASSRAAKPAGSHRTNACSARARRARRPRRPGRPVGRAGPAPAMAIQRRSASSRRAQARAGSATARCRAAPRRRSRRRRRGSAPGVAITIARPRRRHVSSTWSPPDATHRTSAGSRGPTPPPSAASPTTGARSRWPPQCGQVQGSATGVRTTDSAGVGAGRRRPSGPAQRAQRAGCAAARRTRGPAGSRTAGCAPSTGPVSSASRTTSKTRRGIRARQPRRASRSSSRSDSPVDVHLRRRGPHDVAVGARAPRPSRDSTSACASTDRA